MIRICLLALCLPGLAGCEACLQTHGSGTRSYADASPGYSNRTPWITDIQIADFPPVGPDGTVIVEVEDDGDLDYLSYGFRLSGHVNLLGYSDTAVLTGTMLGEGMGTLDLIVVDEHQNWSQEWIDDLVVDLSPPLLEVEDDIIRGGADAELIVWVGDAYVLGAVELTFAGATQRHEFPAVYPPTLGETWDYSLVHFPLGDVPDGIETAYLVATDAVGNRTSLELELSVDGTPPTVEILAPVDGAIVSGLFDVEIALDDPGGGPVWVDLCDGAVTLATATGPLAVITLDALDFAPGPLSIRATAADQAGNTAAAEISLTIAP